MITSRTPPLFIVLASSLPGCGEASGVLVLTDAQNYHYTADLSLERFALRSGADVCIDWTGLGVDMRGAAVDAPSDIDTVWLMVFQGMDPDMLSEALAQDSLGQDDVTLYVSCDPGGTSCCLSQMSFLGNDLGGVQDCFTEGRGSWLVVLSSAQGSQVRSMAILQASDSSSGVEVAITDDTARLTVDVELASLDPVTIPSTADIELDWSGLSRDGLGNGISVHTLDRLLLGRYALDPSALEDRFFQLAGLAERSWELDVDGVNSANLSELAGFDGVTDEGSWWLALMCTACDNPAPRFLTRLEAP